MNVLRRMSRATCTCLIKPAGGDVTTSWSDFIISGTVNRAAYPGNGVTTGVQKFIFGAFSLSHKQMEDNIKTSFKQSRKAVYWSHLARVNTVIKLWAP